MKILLAEDDAETAAYLQRGLTQAGHVVTTVGDGMDALFHASSTSFDAIVLDRMLPRRDGLSVLKMLRAGGIHTPVLMLTAMSRIDDRVDGLENGADDYLIKPFAIQELEARLRALIRRDRRQVSAEVLTVGDLVLDTATLRLTREGRDLQVSPIGLKLLGILMRESPRVVSRADIEREIWGDTLPDSDTLRSHLYNLRKVIDKPFDRPLLHTLHSAGYRMADLAAETPASQQAEATAR